MILFISKLISALPLSVAMAMGRFMGWFWYYILPIRRRVALDNLKMALGNDYTPREQKKIVRETFRHLAMFGFEELRLPSWTAETSEKLVKRVGYENFEKALSKGKGVIIAGIHIGSFDLLGASVGARGIRVAGVFKEIKSG